MFFYVKYDDRFDDKWMVFMHIDKLQEAAIKGFSTEYEALMRCNAANMSLLSGEVDLAANEDDLDNSKCQN